MLFWLRLLRYGGILRSANDKGDGMKEHVNRHVSGAEAARRLSVDRGTIGRWVERGYIKDAFRTPGGRLRIATSEIERLASTR
jgi:excisionase family DNA binding protein